VDILLYLRRIKILLSRTAQEFTEDHGTAMAAAISYYVLFSLFPLLIFAVGVIGIVIQDATLKEELIETVLESVPFDESGDEQFVQNIERIKLVGSGAFGLVGLLGMAWSGSNMFAIIRRSLNVAFDVEVRRPLVRQKLVDFAMIGIIALIFLASLSATATLRITQAVAADVPVIGTLSESLGFGWTLASFFIPVLVSLTAFFIMYWFLPAKSVKKRHAIVGALLAAIFFEAGKVGFSVYLENFGNYNAIYGSIGTVVIFLFWVFISSNILLFFGELTSELPAVMRGDHDESDVPTADSLLPWHVKLRRGTWRLVRGLIFYEPEEERRRQT
jgi:membrane protein